MIDLRLFEDRFSGGLPGPQDLIPGVVDLRPEMVDDLLAGFPDRQGIGVSAALFDRENLRKCLIAVIDEEPLIHDRTTSESLTQSRTRSRTPSSSGLKSIRLAIELIVIP